MQVPTPIVDRRFSFGSMFSALIGSFSTGREAGGTLQVTQLAEGRRCTSPTLTWSATTSGTPPWVDETPPLLRLRAPALQRPLRDRRIAVLVQCPQEACMARASATVAGIRLKSATLAVLPGAGRTLRLALSARVRRAISARLRSHRAIRTRVTVAAADAAANRTSARRTITMRR